MSATQLSACNCAASLHLCFLKCKTFNRQYEKFKAHACTRVHSTTQVPQAPAPGLYCGAGSCNGVGTVLLRSRACCWLMRGAWGCAWGGGGGELVLLPVVLHSQGSPPSAEEEEEWGVALCRWCQAAPVRCQACQSNRHVPRCPLLPHHHRPKYDFQVAFLHSTHGHS